MFHSKIIQGLHLIAANYIATVLVHSSGILEHGGLSRLWIDKRSNTHVRFVAPFFSLHKLFFVAFCSNKNQQPVFISDLTTWTPNFSFAFNLCIDMTIFYVIDVACSDPNEQPKCPDEQPDALHLVFLLPPLPTVPFVRIGKMSPDRPIAFCYCRIGVGKYKILSKSWRRPIFPDCYRRNNEAWVFCTYFKSFVAHSNPPVILHHILLILPP